MDIRLQGEIVGKAAVVPAIAGLTVAAPVSAIYDKLPASEVERMLRSCLTVLALLPAISAQTPSIDPVPIEVAGKISAIDTQRWQGFREGPGLFMTVQNVSGRAIQGYAFETTFTDPASGGRVGPGRSHSTYKQASMGVELAPGAKRELVKPYPVPITANGVPANYSFNVDLVVFADGTTWGPGKTQTAKQLLSQIQGASPKHR